MKGKEASPNEYPGAHSYSIFQEETSYIKGYSACLNIFYSEEYQTMGVHEDNEGFYVVSGNGQMKVGDEEYDLSPGCSMLAPAHVPHAIRKVGTKDLEVFLFHFPK